MSQPRSLAVSLPALLLFVGCGGPETPPKKAEVPAPPKAAAKKPDPHAVYRPKTPLGIDDYHLKIPEDNPMTLAKVELGRQLYFDPRLSQDGTVSCATCHHPEKGWTDQAPVSTGIRGQKGGRSAPTVFNRALTEHQFWDGRAASLEEQALGPVGNPIEMGFSVEKAVERLKKIPGYVEQFQSVFKKEPNGPDMAKAIAAFERTVLVGGAPNDYFEKAEPYLDEETLEPLPPDEDEEPEDTQRRESIMAAWKANRMSPAAQRGREIYFNKGQCSLCHFGPNLADEQYHNIGVGMDKKDFDKGREDFTKKEEDRGAFKTPMLRNLKSTAPYMHDGSQKTLLEVVQFYNQGGHKNPWLSSKIKPLGLTEEEMKDLVVFLEEGLTGPEPKITEPKLPEGPDFFSE